jgi:hypothetical protein
MDQNPSTQVNIVSQIKNLKMKLKNTFHMLINYKPENFTWV